MDSIANIDPEFIRRIEEAYAKDAYNPEISEADSNKQLPFVKDPQTDSKNAPLPWEKEAQAISDNLNQIKQTRTFKIQIESVLDGKTVQVVPTWNDIPTGAKVDRTRRTICEPNANFYRSS